MKKIITFSLILVLCVQFVSPAMAANGNSQNGIKNFDEASIKERADKRITAAQRQAAADRLKAAQQAAGLTTNQQLQAGAGILGTTMPLATPDYFGMTPNYANSPLPSGIMATSVVITDLTGTGAAANATIDPLTGAITAITVTSGGSNYTAPTVAINGAGTGATATATVNAGVITAITVTAGGSGYAVPVTVAIAGVSGTGATATATVTNGIITSATVTAGGSNYSAPTATITGDGTGATATATFDPLTKAITAVNIITGGSGYTTSTIAISDPTGTGAAAVANITNGIITALNLTAGGSGYTAPTVVINDVTGTGASAVATLTGGIITSLTLVSGGSHYTAPNISFIDNSGSGATATATVSNGSISSLTLLTGGSGYSLNTTVTISGGGGSGATAIATVTNGVVTTLTLTNIGSGYLLQRNPNGTLTGGIRKFVDSLPGLGATNTNNLGQYIPLALADTTTYSNSHYYEIALIEYTKQMHSDLPATTLRGYVQLETPVNASTSKHIALTYPNGSPILDKNNNQVYAYDQVQYLGPIIVSQRDVPTRVKFSNYLPTGSGGDLFIPVDNTVMGAGMGPLGMNTTPGYPMDYTQNRATLHLHGGNTPWISDGTPHQWTTPAGELTDYPKGVSVTDVPDMAIPENGSMTFFYTNQQSARLMFYHDHSYGITRLNVYSGEAAPYLIQDPVEQGLVTSGVIPADEIPLVIQDKTFVPSTAQLVMEDPTWDTTAYGGLGNLWFPHVYMPNQNPSDMMGVNAMGRWDYGPWFWPPFTGLTYQPVPNPLCNPTCPPGENPTNPATPNPTIVPEAFMDTPIVNGTAYPFLTVQPKAYRFRILNASNDRTINLQLYYAKSNAAMWNPDGSLNNANAGEVSMVPAVANQPGTIGYPVDITDGRAGGVPDNRTVGPSMIQIGNEGGFLPQPAILNNTPVGYEYNRRSITVLNVSTKNLMLGPAERADVIIDFSQVPSGSKLILYNDSPAPVPGFDPRYDYYTGDPDQTSTGGAPSTQPGYGPNTRTMMQFQISGTASTPYNLTALQTALPAAFAASQNKPIVPEPAYGPAYNTTFPGTYARIQDTTLTFTPIGSTTPVTMNMQPKSIIEDFDPDYGRMNAILGVEIPRTNNINQTSIIQHYIDPATELISNSDVGVQIGSTNDGTQIWKITHNGVDTHSIHTHTADMELINRVGWDGMVKPPEANELGWKETVRMNPLEDVIVAFRPSLPSLPFKIGNSVRPLDPTMPLGSTAGFTNVDPNGNPITVTNQMVNYGNEYVWHCHLLGHEENDMMRVISVASKPEASSGLIATIPNGPYQVNLTWNDNSLKATDFTVQRATDPAFTLNLVNFAVPKVAGIAQSYSDTTAAKKTTYYYQVIANDVVGSGVVGYPSITTSSTPSNAVVVNGIPTYSVLPASLAFGNQTVGTTSVAKTITVTNTGLATLTINRVSLNGNNANQFTQTNNCPTNLIGGATCTITVRFRPTSRGLKNATITVNVANPAVNQSVSLSGTGI